MPNILLAVLETDNATPYFLNLHNGEIPSHLDLGMTCSWHVETEFSLSVDTVIVIRRSNCAICIAVAAASLAKRTNWNADRMRDRRI